jgi:hypothetical protein
LLSCSLFFNFLVYVFHNASASASACALLGCSIFHFQAAIDAFVAALERFQSIGAGGGYKRTIMFIIIIYILF